MKVVCINNTRGNSSHLELGRIYNAREVNAQFGAFLVVEVEPWDSLIEKKKRLRKCEIWIQKDCLMDINDWRVEKLENLFLN